MQVLASRWFYELVELAHSQLDSAATPHSTLRKAGAAAAVPLVHVLCNVGHSIISSSSCAVELASEEVQAAVALLQSEDKGAVSAALLTRVLHNIVSKPGEEKYRLEATAAHNAQ